MTLEHCIARLLEAPTVEIAGAILRLQTELNRRKHAAQDGKAHVTLQPE